MEKRKLEAFANEIVSLSKAREVLANDELSREELKGHFSSLADEYEKLLDETKFLTKVSDKLESKLNTANERLQAFNQEISAEAEEVKNKNEKILQKQRQIVQEKAELDTKVNKFQLTMIIMGALVVICMIFIVYYVIFNAKPGTH